MRIVVIGAGAAGLAAAAALTRRGIAAEVLDRGNVVGESWRDRYDTLHLHTPKSHSGLPFRPMPPGWPRYPGRDRVAAYLGDYAACFGIRPRFGTEVLEVAPAKHGWRVVTADGAEEADAVVVATGLNARPVLPGWPGLDGFPGRVLHSSVYRNAGGFPKRVLVVGFGNSGADIALELCDAGCQVQLAVRSPVNVVPRDLLGVPVVRLQLLQKVFGARIADRLAAPLLRLAVGDLRKVGLGRAAKGPAAQIVEDGRIPVLDHGVVARLHDGSIRVRPGVERFDGSSVLFADGAQAQVDAVVLATGFRTGLEDLLREVPQVLRPDALPRAHGAPGPLPGLYFCGFATRPAGQFRSTGQDARQIARDLAR